MISLGSILSIYRELKAGHSMKSTQSKDKEVKTN